MNALQTINTLHFKSVGNVERSHEARLNAEVGACNGRLELSDVTCSTWSIDSLPNDTSTPGHL